VSPAEAGSPGEWCEDQNRQEEEHARDLKPEDSPDAAEWAQESPDPAGDPMCGLPGNLLDGANLGVRLSGAGADRGWPAGSGLGAGGQSLACDASCDTQAGTENAANGMRLHFDSMLTARLPGVACDRDSTF
jgi:hypothetical protein